MIWVHFSNGLWEKKLCFFSGQFGILAILCVLKLRYTEHIIRKIIVRGASYWRCDPEDGDHQKFHPFFQLCHYFLKIANFLVTDG
jgi:hypothetical protein